MVGELRNGLAELFALPDGYEVLLGNGGTTAFWDAATFGLIEQRSQHLSLRRVLVEVRRGRRRRAAPRRARRSSRRTPAPTPSLSPRTGVDAYCLTHNETSTGVAMPLSRPGRRRPGRWSTPRRRRAGMRFDLSITDVYYFAPQKALASDGGLWLAACSPAAIERIERMAASDRWVPASLDLEIALDNSRKDQTYNTPALATIFLADAAGPLDHRQRRPRVRGRPLRDVGRDPLRLGRGPRLRHAVRGRPGHALATSSAPSTSTSVDANTIAARPAGQRHRRHRQLPQARPQPAAHRPVPGHRPADVAALTRCIDFVVERAAPRPVPSAWPGLPAHRRPDSCVRLCASVPCVSPDRGRWRTAREESAR